MLETTHARLERSEFAWRALIVIGLLAAAALACYAARVFLLAFAALLLALLLDFFASWLSARSGWSRSRSFACVLFAVVAITVGACWIIVPRVADQISQFVHFTPQAFDRLTASLQKSEWGQTLLQYLPNLLGSVNLGAILSMAVRNGLTGAVGFAVFAVVGIFVGANPDLYESGFLKLFPRPHRVEIRRVLAELAYWLRWWMLGQLVPMSVLGVASVIGLGLLNVRLAFTLGLFTGFMVFIPYVGAWIAYAVTLPMAALQGPGLILKVTLLFVVVHLLEGYLITPLVQRHTVYLPPGLTIVAQVLLGLLLGVFGLAFAAPLTAAAMVLVKKLYLHEELQHHGA